MDRIHYKSNGKTAVKSPTFALANIKYFNIHVNSMLPTWALVCISVLIIFVILFIIAIIKLIKWLILLGIALVIAAGAILWYLGYLPP